MLPPEADPSVDTYKAKYDMFIWSWYETVEPNVLASRGKNTPLAGRQLAGRVLFTVAGGRLAYEAAD